MICVGAVLLRLPGVDPLHQSRPGVVDLSLQRFDVRCAQVPIAALQSQVIAQRPRLRSIVERVGASVLEFVERERTALDRITRGGGACVVGQALAVEVGNEQRDDPCAPQGLGFLDFADQVGKESHARGRDIRHLVRRHDLGEILLARKLARGRGASLARCGVEDDF